MACMPRHHLPRFNELSGLDTRLASGLCAGRAQSAYFYSTEILAYVWSPVSVAAALEMSVTAATVVASATVAIAVANNDDHLRDGHGVDYRLHDGYDDVIVDDGSPSLPFSTNNDEGNGFPTRHTSSNADPCLQFPLQDSARKTNPSRGLLALSSNTP